MKNDNYIYGDDPEILLKQYARLYMFGGGCFIVFLIGLFGASMLVGYLIGRLIV